MKSCSEDFGPFDGNIWINCSHQGPLPRVAVEALHEAIEWKVKPFNLNSDRFTGTIREMRSVLGKLICAPSEEIILANSNSYGIHLLANGLQWRAGDEILLMKGDFPSNILPWLSLRKKGVKIRFIDPENYVVQEDELKKHITPATKLFCVSWVHSFSGYAVDIEALGEICRSNNITFVVNGSQAIGTRDLNISKVKIDALTSVGFKWLCGPYGTGFCWIRPKILQSLTYNKAYWLSMMTADDLGNNLDNIEFPEEQFTGKYDIFGTANFFNYKPWKAAVEYLLQIGIENIETYNKNSVKYLIEGIDRDKYDIVSPVEGDCQSTLFFVSNKNPNNNKEIYTILKSKKIHIAFRNGKLRLAPHIHNTIQDLEKALGILNAY
ncbi:aminotransferase class V-fold PLP-dependent enzyme [candidate division KSB1 bacterium]|nr:aminotransferase class V-fold PLP-dependent enzyme [candidate division KSB1 bacterium]